MSNKYISISTSFFGKIKRKYTRAYVQIRQYYVTVKIRNS